MDGEEFLRSLGVTPGNEDFARSSRPDCSVGVEASHMG